jgi:hypothetical protein
VTLGLKVKYKLIIKIFRGARHHLISDAHAELTHQFLARRLSARINSFGVCSVYASVPDAYAQHVLKVPFQISYVRSVHDQFLTRMLSARISS